MREGAKTVEVVAALIRRGERFLVCRRPAHKARGLLWEFVGGKVEPNEDGPQALVRECMEELGVAVRAGDAFMDVTHEYPELAVHLTLYEAEIVRGEPQLLEHCELRWITAQEIDGLAFCPADQAFCRALKSM